MIFLHAQKDKHLLNGHQCASDNYQPWAYMHLSFLCSSIAVALTMIDLQGFAAVSVCPDPTEACVTVMHHSGIGTMQVSDTILSFEGFGG